MRVWIMTLAEKNHPETPAYAEDPNPAEARAAVRVDDFADLLPVLTGWAQILGPTITAYAKAVPADATAEEICRLWQDSPDMIRLDRLPGGYIKIADYREAEPNGRPYDEPDQLTQTAPALTGRRH